MLCRHFFYLLVINKLLFVLWVNNITVNTQIVCLNFSHRVILAVCIIPATHLTSLMSSRWRKCLTRLVQRQGDPKLTTLIRGSECKAPGTTKAALATLLKYFPSTPAPFLSVPLMEFSSPTSVGASWWGAQKWSYEFNRIASYAFLFLSGLLRLFLHSQLSPAKYRDKDQHLCSARGGHPSCV